MSNEPLMQIKDLVREFVNGDVVTPALKGVTFDIEEGEFVAIMGPSGSGKSTLMHILGFLDRLTRGSYAFRGKDIGPMETNDLALMRRNEVGFVFQSFNLLKKSTVLENVMLPSLYAGVNAKKRVEIAEKAIESVSMTHRRDHFSNQLSGGERQRVAIARALVNNPAVIFADEPTGNLDTKTGEQVLELLADLNDEGRTIIMVTHEQEAAEYAKRILRFRDGLLEKDEVVEKRRRNGYFK